MSDRRRGVIPDRDKREASQAAKSYRRVSRQRSTSPLHRHARRTIVGILHNVHHYPNAGESDAILSQYVPPHVLSYLGDEGTRIVPLTEGVS